MIFNKEVSLKAYNTFGIESVAAYFAVISSKQALKHALQNAPAPLLVLGGGSNILLTKDYYNNAVIAIASKGIEVIQATSNHVYLKVQAGENWSDFVDYCVATGYGGVENMALIPGNVGTAPIQNIGAYGVELKDVFESCTAIEIDTLKETIFTNEDCNFGYRHSIFKTSKYKDKYIITDVTFKLTKGTPIFYTSYGGIFKELECQGNKELSIGAIANAVKRIRTRKLPDPKLIGNSGSFFKNPIISKCNFEVLQQKFPDIVFYPQTDDHVKIPAAWLIDRLGLKGHTYRNAGVHLQQPLVLINKTGEATGQEILALARYIQEMVLENYQIHLEFEVNIL